MNKYFKHNYFVTAKLLLIFIIVLLYQKRNNPHRRINANKFKTYDPIKYFAFTALGRSLDIGKYHHKLIETKILRDRFISSRQFTLKAINLQLFAGTQYYIADSDGNDSYNGLYPTFQSGSDGPWKTIGKANTVLTAGDTVDIRTGTYVGSISPSNDGTSGNLITYQNYSGESPVIGGGAVQYGINIQGSLGSEREYIRIKSITISGQTSAGARWFTLDYCDYLELEDCILTGTGTNYQYDFSMIHHSNYCQFLNVEWDGSDISESADKQYDLLDASYNTHCLWKDCLIGDCSHTPFWCEGGQSGSYPDYNAIIDCTFTNKWRRAFEIMPKTSSHVLPQRWLFQGNTLQDVGWSNATCPNSADRDRVSLNKFHGRYFIIRENIAYGCDIVVNFRTLTDRNNQNNYMYHNTWFNAEKPSGNSDGGFLWWDYNNQGQLLNNVIINNIFWDYDGIISGDGNKYTVRNVVYSPGVNPSGNTIEYNVFGRKDNGGTESYIKWSPYAGTLSSIEASSSEWANNIQADPIFVNESSSPPDLNLQSSSPCRNAGTHLTLTNGSGSNSTSLIVDDASYFFSGSGAPWNLEGTTADTIYIEDTGEVTIASINYATNTITLTAPATWGNNKKVYHRKYSGSAPDIGAFEYDEGGLEIALIFAS